MTTQHSGMRKVAEHLIDKILANWQDPIDERMKLLLKRQLKDSEFTERDARSLEALATKH